MPVNEGLAHLSDTLLFVTVCIYTVAALGFAAEFSFSRRAGVARMLARAERSAPVAGSLVRAGALVGGPAGTDGPVPPPPVTPAGPGPRSDRETLGDRLGQVAIALTVLGFGTHLATVVTRGLAAHRVPWGNMYEFSVTTALVLVGGFLALLTRERVRFLGAFVLLLVVLLLALAGTVLYTAAGPLVPALQSYWIRIHVAAAITASGTFALGAVITVLYLVRAAHERNPERWGLGRLLPPAESLDRIAYRVHAFAFPIWTFAIIAGAIWAEAAWGRYWGWDPKETWSFITWVVYAAYLHARTTAGWRGGRAAAIALVGFGALTFDYYIVNIFLVGLHSYAGV